MAEKVRNWAPLYSSRENVEVELFTECVIGGAAHLMTYFYSGNGTPAYSMPSTEYESPEEVRYI